MPSPDFLFGSVEMGGSLTPIISVVEYVHFRRAAVMRANRRSKSALSSLIRLLRHQKAINVVPLWAQVTERETDNPYTCTAAWVTGPHPRKWWQLLRPRYRVVSTYVRQASPPDRDLAELDRSPNGMMGRVKRGGVNERPEGPRPTPPPKPPEGFTEAEERRLAAMFPNLKPWQIKQYMKRNRKFS